MGTLADRVARLEQTRRTDTAGDHVAALAGLLALLDAHDRGKAFPSFNPHSPAASNEASMKLLVLLGRKDAERTAAQTHGN